MNSQHTKMTIGLREGNAYCRDLIMIYCTHLLNDHNVPHKYVQTSQLKKLSVYVYVCISDKQKNIKKTAEG